MPSLANGGAEKVMTTLLNNMDLSIFKPILLLLDRRGNYLKDLRKEIIVEDLGGVRVSRSLPKLVTWIRHHKPNVVLSSLSHLNLALGAIKPLLPRSTKVVVRESSIPSIHTKTDRKGKIMFGLYKHFYNNVDAVICQCEFMRRDLSSCFSLPDELLLVINNPVDVLRITLQAKGTSDDCELDSCNGNVLNVVAVGSLEKHKQYDQLIRALSNLDRPWRLKLLGDGSELDNLKSLASNKGVLENINFMGRLNNPYPYMKTADVLVLVSSFEGFPNVVLESLSLGTPVISYECPGGVKEILDGEEFGVLIPHNEETALTHALMQFDPSDYDEQSIANFIKKRFGIRTILSQYQSVLTNL